MSYFVIEDFRQGLDARKHRLSLPPGALYIGKNININRGGEIETCKDFVSKYALPASATFGLCSAGGQIFVFGSTATPAALPAGVQYQRLQHPDGLAMTGIVFTTVVRGKIYAIASFTGGVIEQFYNGVLISDWATGAVGGTMASMADVAAHFAAVISTDPSYAATASGNIVTITGQPGVTFATSASAVNGGAVNDQYASVGLSRAAVAPVAEVLSTGSLTIAGATAGGQISSVKVNGVEILGATITNPGSDAGMAQLVAAQINSDVSAPDYTASVAGNVVTIKAAPGTGAGPNAWVVGDTTTMGAGIVTTTNMSGGVSAAVGIAQISTVTFGGTFEAGDVFSVTLGATTFGGTSGAAGEQATCALPWQGKVYAVADQNLFGSAIDDPTTWNGGTGSFVIDMSSQVMGAETLTALGIFQNQLAVFARNTTQIWNVDSDPNNNALVQTLQNIGTMAPKTVLAFGDQDLFFLSDTGLRSLKVRLVSVTNATMSDIGSPIDPLIIAAIASAGGGASKACSVIDPVDGRYMLHIGTVTYAFSFYPSAKVAAWTTYEFGLAITDFAALAEQVYARAGDTIYLVGGDTNAVYTSQAPVVQLPFLSNRQIDTLKHFTGINLSCDGTWTVNMATDPNQPAEFETLAIATESTYGQGGVPIDGESNVISLQFVGQGDKNYARVAGVTLAYEPVEQAA